jgi:hypothetical protein
MFVRVRACVWRGSNVLKVVKVNSATVNGSTM